MPIPPLIRFSQFNTSFQNPSGVRHLKISSSGWIKTLSQVAGEFLDFGAVNISNGKRTTGTKAVVAMVDNMKDATEAVFNLRFWISNTIDFNFGTFFFNGFPSGQWIQDIQLTDASGKYVPTALPSGQNWWRDAGGEFDRDSLAFQEITASGLDSQVTQWFYLSNSIDIDVPVKVYGGDSGGWVFRLTFDYR